MQPENIIQYISGNGRQRAALIWLHGLGANGEDLATLTESITPPEDWEIQHILPTAPTRPVLINQNQPTRAWFDIHQLVEPKLDDPEGTEASAAWIWSQMDQLKQQGVNSNNIALIGFSQGGAMAFYAGLRYQHKLAGIVGLSTCIANRDDNLPPTAPENAKTPIFLAHGTHDLILRPHLGQAARDILSDAGHEVTWKEYPIEHNICREEMQDLQQWLDAKLFNKDF